MNHRPTAQLAHYLHIFACVYVVHKTAHVVDVNCLFSLVGMQYKGKMQNYSSDEMAS